MFDRASRHVGVSTPEGQRAPERGEPNTVLAAARCGMVAVRYADAYGRVHDAVLMEMDGRLYMPPNGEEWATKLKEVQSWMLKGINAALPQEAAPTHLPQHDAVDVMDKG